MAFVQNFPLFSILLPIICGFLCLSLRPGAAGYAMLAVFTAECVMSAAVLIRSISTRMGFTYMMGHFPAPFGNEIRAGALEALMALVFSVVMLLSVAGGLDDLEYDIPAKKHSFFFLMSGFLLAAMLAVIYTNDLFTAYVFIEIITLSACSIIAVREGGKPLIATMSYLIMSLIGSALLLLSIALLYTLTGQLLMPDLRSGIQEITQSGSYGMPLLILMGLMITGLGIKCALFPFHSWLPNAHAHATTSASSVLSGLIVKCYMFLLAKLFIRVFGLEVVNQLSAGSILIVLGILGLIFGSLAAIRQRDIKQMLSYSTVSQIGYISIALGLGSEAGIAAACFHMIVHAAAKAMLFTSAGGLIRASGRKKDFGALSGAARRDPVSGAAFICGALAMVGIPLFSGFVSKLYTSAAAAISPAGAPLGAAVILSVVVLSTVLNAVYYFPVVICILAKQPGARAAAGAAAAGAGIAAVEAGAAAGAGIASAAAGEAAGAEIASAEVGEAAGAEIASAAAGAAAGAEIASAAAGAAAAGADVIERATPAAHAGRSPAYSVTLAVFMAANIALGIFSQPVFRIIDLGLSVF